MTLLRIRIISGKCWISESFIKKVVQVHDQGLRFNLIHDRQYGFRQFRSTFDILAHITHKWNKALETGKKTFVIGLDISKAFNQVWYKHLLAKLPAFGLPSYNLEISRN